MCKTYGITNNKRHGMGGGDKRGDSATMKIVNQKLMRVENLAASRLCFH